MANTDQLVGLPSAADFEDIEVPEFDRVYFKRQGPASTKDNPKGRQFSASGPKANLIAQMIFADMGLTRSQMATIAKCSPSRVSEVIWAMEAAVKRGQLESFPPVPTKPVLTEPTDEETTDENVEPQGDDIVRMPSELAQEIRDLLENNNEESESDDSA